MISKNGCEGRQELRSLWYGVGGVFGWWVKSGFKPWFYWLREVVAAKTWFLVSGKLMGDKKMRWSPEAQICPLRRFRGWVVYLYGQIEKRGLKSILEASEKLVSILSSQSLLFPLENEVKKQRWYFYPISRVYLFFIDYKRDLRVKSGFGVLEASALFSQVLVF